VADAWSRLRKRRHQYYLGRQKRAFKDGTGFGVQGGLHYRKGVDLETILRQVREGTRVAVRQTKSESLHRVGEDLFVKTTSPARARRIWENAHGLALRGIDTPKLWAWERRWVAGEWVESVDLPGYILGSYGALPRAERRDFLALLARRVRRLHDYGVYHADLKAGNILIGDGRILVIDLDRLRFSVDLPERDRLFNLAQLNAAVTPPLTRTDRLRFLDQYIGNCASLRELRGRWIREIMKATIGRRHRWPAATDSWSGAANNKK